MVLSAGVPPSITEADPEPSRINTYTLIAPAVVPKGLPTGQGWQFVPDMRRTLADTHKLVAEMPAHNTPNQHRLRQYRRRLYEEDPITKSQRNSPGSSQSASRALTETTRDNQRALGQVDNSMARVQSVQPDLPATFLNPLATVYVPPPARSAPSVKHLECYFWRRGSCKFTAQECLYAHEPTGQMAEGPRAVELGKPAVAGKNATSASPTYQNWRGVHRQARLSNAESSGNQTSTQNDRSFPLVIVRPIPWDRRNTGAERSQEDSTLQVGSP